MKHASQATPTPRVRIQELGTTLRTALVAVLAEVGGASIRPVALARALKLDDSLAARLLRSVRASDPLSSLRELPAPQGLRLFLDAASRAGISPAARQAADSAVSELEKLINELPLGRTSLDTAIDGWLPSGRARAERAAKQAVYKALAQTLGYTVDTACFSLAIQPSASGECCDALSFMALDGIRRQREGSPILLFGVTHSEFVAQAEARKHLPQQIIETLSGEREATDAKKFLLMDVGDTGTLPIKYVDRGTHTRLVLDSSEPPLNIPITTAMANVARNAYMRYQSPTATTEAVHFAIKIPIRVFVQDLFLHEDVYPALIPTLVSRLDYFSNDPSVRDPELLEMDQIDVDADYVRLGWGLGRIGVKEWAGYEPAIRSTFQRAGWDPDRFRAFRCYVRHPFPFLSMTTWFDLPKAP